MQVTFIRHGESTANAGLPSTDPAAIALTPRGQAQAAEVASAWEQVPALIAVSPFLRTRLTAQPTIARFPQVPVEVLPMEEFTYLEPARWNGTTRDQRLPMITRYWQNADPHYRDGPGAESFDMLLGRVEATLAHLQVCAADGPVYAFGHGQFMQALRLMLLHPGRSAREQMAHFGAFDAAHPIRNVDRMTIHRMEGVWTVDGAETPASAAGRRAF